MEKVSSKMALRSPKLAHDTLKMAKDVPEKAPEILEMPQVTSKTTPRRPKVAEEPPKMAQGAPKTSKMARQRSQRVPRWPEDCPRRSQASRKEPPGRPKTAKIFPGWHKTAPRWYKIDQHDPNRPPKHPRYPPDVKMSVWPQREHHFELPSPSLKQPEVGARWRKLVPRWP